MNKKFIMFGLLSVFLLATISSVLGAYNYTSNAVSNHAETINILGLKIMNGSTSRVVTATNGQLNTLIVSGTAAAKRKYNLTFYDNNFFTNRTYLNYNYSLLGNLTATLTYNTRNGANHTVTAISSYFGALTGFIVNFRNGSTSRNFTAPHYDVAKITQLNTRRYNVTVYSDDHTPTTTLNYRFNTSGNLVVQMPFISTADSTACLGVRAIAYSALALLAVAIIVLTAFALINQNINVGMVVMIMALAIAIMIGFIIMSYVSSSLCLAI